MRLAKINNWRKIVLSLTLARIFLGLPLLLSLNFGNFKLAIFLLIFAGATDFLDGFWARKFNCSSILGAKLDPLADKILIFAPLIWIAKQGILPIWAIWVLFSRELIISSWRSSEVDGGPASTSGKLKTTFQFISILFLIWPNAWGSSHQILLIKQLGNLFFWISFFLAISSCSKYINLRKDSRLG